MGKKNTSTHIVPHDAVLRILRRNPLQVASLGRSNPTDFSTRGKHIDSTNQNIKIVLILSNIPTTVQIGIGRLGALQLGV